MFGRMLATILLCASLLAARGATTQEPPVSVLLDNVRQFANSVVNYEGDARISAAFADDVFKGAKQASIAADKAIAAGVPSTRTITLNTGNSDRPMTLAEIKAMCERIAKVAAFSNAAQAIVNTSSWPKYIADGTINEEIQAKGAFQTSKFCVAKVDEAIANGVPDSTAIVEGDWKMTLAEGREMC